MMMQNLINFIAFLSQPEISIDDEHEASIHGSSLNMLE